MNTENAIRYVTAADAKGLQSLVGKALASYGKARIAVQVAIVAVLIHAAKHHDYSQATELVKGLGNTKTARDVATFFRDFGGFKSVATTNEAGEKVEPDGFNDWSGPGYITEKMESGQTRLDVAKATMFYEYKQARESVFKEYSVEQMARQFIDGVARARKRATDGKATIKDDLSETTMQSVLNLVKFESIAAKAAHDDESKPERKAANA